MMITRGKQVIDLPFPDSGHASCRWVHPATTVDDLRQEWDGTATPTYYLVEADPPADGKIGPHCFDLEALSCLLGVTDFCVVVSGGEIYNPGLFQKLLRDHSYPGSIISILLSQDDAHASWLNFVVAHSPPTIDVLQILDEAQVADFPLSPEHQHDVYFKPRFGRLAS